MSAPLLELRNVRKVYGAVTAVDGVSLSLARGAVQTTRLLLAGIVVSVVLGAATSWITLMGPDVLRNLQGFMMGQTGLIGWSSCTWLWAVWGVVMPLAWAMSRRQRSPSWCPW